MGAVHRRSSRPSVSSPIVVLAAVVLAVCACQLSCQAAADRLLLAGARAAAASTAVTSHGSALHAGVAAGMRHLHSLSAVSSHSSALDAGVAASMRHLHSIPATGLSSAAGLAAAAGSGGGAAAARTLQYASRRQVEEYSAHGL